MVSTYCSRWYPFAKLHMGSGIPVLVTSSGRPTRPLETRAPGPSSVWSRRPVVVVAANGHRHGVRTRGPAAGWRTLPVSAIVASRPALPTIRGDHIATHE